MSALHRRADAARRLPPISGATLGDWDGLADRDPFAQRRRRRGRPNIVVEVVTRHTATVRGKYVVAAIRHAGCRSQYLYRPPDDGTACWAVPARAAVDVVAAAEHLGGRADFREWLIAS